jgi:hypothetical protein
MRTVRDNVMIDRTLKATQTVLEQAEVLSAECAAA